ncbi:MAG: DUF1015 domain-containing protein [Verrucomicrobia bacterium]|nr:DUF1015 domain-containing protein [Verrucomicrobiota bacterium]
MRIKPFQALRPQAELARLVASVPYDVVDTEEARELAKGNPRSFLRIGRPEIDLSPGTDIYSDEVYAKGLENFLRFQNEKTLVREDREYLYVYRLVMGKHIQRGVVTCCRVEDYESNLIKKHEKTRTEKEKDRTRYVDTLNAHTGPIFLTYRDDAAIDRLVADAERDQPLFDFTAVDGIKHTIWRVAATADVINAFKNVPLCYIADGHHRAAAAVRVGIERRSGNQGHRGDEEYNWFMGVLFPASQLQILPYNRCVSDLNGLTQGDFVKAVAGKLNLREGAPPSPVGSRNVSMYLAGRWYGISWDADLVQDPVMSLDVSVVQDRILEPILGIKDPRTDKRIEFTGGIRGPGELVKNVDSGKAAVAFSMYPVTVNQMMAIADAGRIMPPKSTWFEPKLRSGLLIHTI